MNRGAHHPRHPLDSGGVAPMCGLSVVSAYKCNEHVSITIYRYQD